MVLVTVYDIEGNEIDDLGGFYVSDTVEGRVSAKAIIRDNPNVRFCKLEVYDKVGGRLLATSGVFNARRK